MNSSLCGWRSLQGDIIVKFLFSFCGKNFSILPLYEVFYISSCEWEILVLVLVLVVVSGLDPPRGHTEVPPCQECLRLTWCCRSTGLWNFTAGTKPALPPVDNDRQ